METGLAGDKRAVRDKEMSPALELWPCCSEGCPDRAVWHQVWLIDTGGVTASGRSHPLLTASFRSWARLSFNTLQMSLSWGPPRVWYWGVAVSWCLC